MNLIIYVCLLLMALLMPKSKTVTGTIMLFMFFMFSFVYYKGDLQIYEWVYNDFYTGQFITAYEPAFIGMIWICNVIGLPFSGFRAILAMTYLTLTYKAIQQQTDYTAITMALMIIFPFFVFTSVLRSGIASAIVLYAMSFLTKKSINFKLKYAICIIIATLFHYSSIVFFVFLLNKRKITIKMIITCSMIAIGAFILLNYTDLPYRLISIVTSSKKVLQWFVKGTAGSNLKGSTITAIILAVNLFLVKKAKRICHSPNGRLVLSEQRIRFSEITYNVSLIMFFFLPLMLLASPFLRLPYMIFGMVISVCVNATKVLCFSLKQKRTKMSPPTIMAFGFSLFAITLVWRFYYCLPYLKQGMVFFGEFLNTKVIF